MARVAVFGEHGPNLLFEEVVAAVLSERGGGDGEDGDERDQSHGESRVGYTSRLAKPRHEGSAESLYLFSVRKMQRNRVNPASAKQMQSSMIDLLVRCFLLLHLAHRLHGQERRERIGSASDNAGLLDRIGDDFPRRR